MYLCTDLRTPSVCTNQGESINVRAIHQPKTRSIPFSSLSVPSVIGKQTSCPAAAPAPSSVGVHLPSLIVSGCRSYLRNDHYHRLRTPISGACTLVVYNLGICSLLRLRSLEKVRRVFFPCPVCGYIWN